MPTASPPLPRTSAWQTPSFQAIFWLIAGFTLLRLCMAATVPLLPQEAYYWTWSRFPDWSYFDHPPLASYMIWLTTAVVGSTVFGVKLAAVVWSLGWNLLWAKLLQDLWGDRRLTFWSLLALNLTLLYEFYGFGPSPDGPLMFFWLATLWAIWRLSVTGQARWWYVAGLCLGLSWLGKYAGALLVPITVLYLLVVPRLRHWLATPHPYLALLLALAVFSPVIVWNLQHDWASIAFQSSRRVGEMDRFKPRFFLLLVFTQFVVLTPYLFWLALRGLGSGVRAALRRTLDAQGWLLLLSALVPLLLFTAVSFRANSKVNWLMPAWWALIVLGLRTLLAQPATQATKLRQLRWGLGSSAALLLALGAAAQVPNLPLPGDLNIWSGWKDAAARIDQIEAELHAQGQKTFVFSPSYKSSSLLWFYNAGQDRTYAQDIYGERALQYDYFPRPDDLRGATGLLVTSDMPQTGIDLDKLRPYFTHIERIAVVESSQLQQDTRRIEIYRCTGYRGHPKGPR
ncbi:ArnT family glycosyltransferase [Extensimonas vulgaris]|uniref:Dolichyl-phosphate-mannose-protein mannosyltransferase n=1 Tax=Extensimonas vulgaris TaxID=1031594 RepID=A0A369AJW3_9BURK|nr:glycosyltransferase family 39 protein [Extensimonas vulgaris]RCX08576.1 dolichyl-phosphate-mannose-protein mannosyltransferase [Extensimonas vulgaris]TWI36191.1 dolichol-phosphate mannosyltransferase [Extensimonas vulgaris]TXD14025.1 glycosyltransferase family 39 protein [Extensimonas vulgaris]